MADNPIIKDLSNQAGNFVEGAVNNTLGSVGKALNSITSPTELISAIRKATLPLGGNVFTSTLVEFLGPENDDDWRVRLSIPYNFFMSSAVLAPLVDAGGFIFPYVPTITISGSANYDPQSLTHQNFQAVSYQSSNPGTISITGDFHVEDATQAQYWIAAVHFLRSVTKMYTGDTSQHGSPPPVLSLNGYGDFVFKRIPVVVSSFNITMDNNCDYISTSPDRGLNVGNVSSASAFLLGGGIGSNLGSDLLTSGINSFIGGGESHVPTKSTITVDLIPTYSREAMRQFSLQTFVNGGYVRGGFI
jgi:hypothetical protein